MSSLGQAFTVNMYCIQIYPFWNHPQLNLLSELYVHHTGIIRSFLARHSHYSRQDNRERVYLSPELSIAKLHRMFLEAHEPEYIQMQEMNIQHRNAHQPVEKLWKPLVSEHLYHDIFISDFNFHLGYPQSDTCDTYDSLKLQMEQTCEAEKAALQKQHDDHLALAKCGYDTLHYDQNLSKQSWEAQTQPCHSSDPTNFFNVQ